MALTTFRYLILNIMLFIFAAQPALCKTGDKSKTSDQISVAREIPVVRWTANRDEMNFRYNFLENLEHITLHTGIPETGTYNHHPHLTYFKGVFYATWDIHIRDENGSGQYGLMRRSTDQGKTWSPVEELFPAPDKMVSMTEAYIGTRFQNADGFAVVDDILYVVTAVDEWAGPNVRLRHRINIGQLCRSINPDGTLGKIFWLLSEAPEPVKGFPAYPAGDPVLVKKINNYFRQPGNEIQLKFGPREHLPDADDNHQLSEPVPAWQLTDGTWVKLYRDGGLRGLPIPDQGPKKELEASKKRRNYASFSFDDGKTWTTPTCTSFPDACARTHAGKLPDGQVYVINNVLPLSTKHGGRQLLAISLARDGLNFDRVAVIRFVAPPQRYKGFARSRGFAYPHSVVVGDNLWFIHSINKEDIAVTRIPLNELYKIK